MPSLGRSLVKFRRRLLVAVCAASLTGCGPDHLFEDGLFDVSTPGCDEVLAGYLMISSVDGPLEVGASRLVGVTGPGPFDLLAAACEGRLDSVTWASLDPATRAEGKRPFRIHGRARFPAEAGGLYSLLACQERNGPLYWVRDENSLACASEECPAE